MKVNIEVKAYDCEAMRTMGAYGILCSINIKKALDGEKNCMDPCTAACVFNSCSEKSISECETAQALIDNACFSTDYDGAKFEAANLEAVTVLQEAEEEEEE